MDEAVQAGEADFVVDGGATKNSFDYSDRAAQTFNNPMRERGVATEPPPVLTYVCGGGLIQMMKKGRSN